MDLKIEEGKAKRAVGEKTDFIAYGLDQEQREAVFSQEQALCVIAGAGSGKTRVLTKRVSRRILDGSTQAKNTMVLTFTKKAAVELSNRLSSLKLGGERRSSFEVNGDLPNGVTTGTFHAVAYAQLRRYFADKSKKAPSVAVNPYHILGKVLSKISPKTRFDQSNSILSEISWAKSQGYNTDQYGVFYKERSRHLVCSLDDFVKIWDGYEQEKSKKYVWDYDDLLINLTNLLFQDKEFQEVQRWKFQHFYVDEFQDLNPAQFRLLRAWLGDRQDIFLVGDPHQSIYGWNGADASILKNIKDVFQGIKVMELSTNYRSTPAVLRVAHSVLHRDQKNAISENEENGLGVIPTINSYENEEEEAREIARQIRKARSNGYAWNDIAVLVRTNAQKCFIEQVCKQFFIPINSNSGSDWLSRKELKNVIAFLKERPFERLAKYLPDLDEFMQESLEAECNNSAQDDSLQSDSAQSYSTEGKIAVLYEELQNAAKKSVNEDYTITVSEFLSFIDIAERHDAARISETSAVSITTFHRSKGLEWDVVFVAGVEQGLVPLSTHPDIVEEERRLFYVALTRGKTELYCSWVKSRKNSNGESKKRTMSMWLDGMRKTCEEMKIESEKAPRGRLSFREYLGVMRKTLDQGVASD